MSPLTNKKNASLHLWLANIHLLTFDLPFDTSLPCPDCRHALPDTHLTSNHHLYLPIQIPYCLLCFWLALFILICASLINPSPLDLICPLYQALLEKISPKVDRPSRSNEYPAADWRLGKAGHYAGMTDWTGSNQQIPVVIQCRNN